MVDRSLFTDAAKALSVATNLDADFCAPFVSAFGVDRATVVTLGVPLGAEVVCATDDHAARLAEIEFDLGEGPGCESLATRRPVLHPDVLKVHSVSWPVAWQAFQGAGVGGVFAFPLTVAGMDVGAVILFTGTAHALTDREVTDAVMLSAILARQVMRRALHAAQRPGEDAGMGAGDYSRLEVHQATGMVLAQMRITPADALVVLQGHAFATGRPVRNVAADVIARTLDFTSSDNFS